MICLFYPDIYGDMMLHVCNSIFFQNVYIFIVHEYICNHYFSDILDFIQLYICILTFIVKASLFDIQNFLHKKFSVLIVLSQKGRGVLMFTICFKY